jgi:hypothetical protein
LLENLSAVLNPAVTHQTTTPQALAQKVSAAPAAFLGQATFASNALGKPSFAKDTFSSSAASPQNQSSNAVQNLTVASAAALPLFPAFGWAASLLPLTAAFSVQVGQQLVNGVDAFMTNSRLSARRFSRSVSKLNAKATGQTLEMPKVKLPILPASPLSFMA